MKHPVQDRHGNAVQSFRYDHRSINNTALFSFCKYIPNDCLLDFFQMGQGKKIVSYEEGGHNGENGIDSRSRRKYLLLFY